MAEQIRRVTVWSSRLRLAHWLMGGATMVLIATGWLLEAAPSLAAVASDLAVAEGKVAAVGALARAQARTVLDARGLALLHRLTEAAGAKRIGMRPLRDLLRS